MSVHKSLLAAVVIGNVLLVSWHMRKHSVPWGVVEVFFGYILFNVPILVSALTSERISADLRGRLLNLLNKFNPIVTGGLGFLLLYFAAQQPVYFPLIIFHGPFAMSIISMFFLSNVFWLCIFVPET